jgi:hypothetical protein
MVGGVLVVRRRFTVIEDSEIRACFHPQIVRQTRMQARNIVVEIAGRGPGQQTSVEIRRAGVAVNAAPGGIFEDDYENGLDRWKLLAGASRRKHYDYAGRQPKTTRTFPDSL